MKTMMCFLRMKCLSMRALLLTVGILFCGHTFAIDFEKDGVYYSGNPSEGTAVVVAPPNSEKYSGSIVIPWLFLYDGQYIVVSGIADNAFQGATGLTSIKLPMVDLVPFSIGDLAFNDCTGLTSFTIPANVTHIGEKAFYFCDKLKDLYVCTSDPSTLEIGADAFSNINRGGNVCTLHVPVGAKAAYEAHAVFGSKFSVIEEGEVPVGYPVIVCDKQVTNSNTADILGNGVASYNPSTKTLTLKGDITDLSYFLSPIYSYDPEGTTINVAKDAVIYNAAGPAISCLGDLTITGSAQLTLKTNRSHVFEAESGALTLDHANVVFEGSYGIRGYNKKDMNIIASSVRGSVKKGAAIESYKDMVLTDCVLVNPKGGTYDTDKCILVDAEGAECQTVNIQPMNVVEKYQLTIAGTQVTSDNMNDILGNGVASYNPSTMTLALKGDINAPEGKGAIFNMGIDGLTINVAKDITLSSTGANTIYCMGNTTLVGTAKLTLNAANSIPVNAFNNLTLNNLTVEFTGKYGMHGMGILYVKGATVIGTATEGAALYDWEGVSLLECSIKEPTSGKYDKNANQLVDKNGAPCPTVLIQGKENPVLKFSKELCNTTIGEAFVAPELEASAGNIVFTSSNTDVAKVNGLGEVTIVGEGVTAITATYEANKDYNAATAQYYIVVSSSKGTRCDADGDGTVDVNDVQTVINYILKK